MLAWVAPSVAMADLERALENYLLIVKGKRRLMIYPQPRLRGHSKSTTD
jgi:hypothetical protein